MSTTLITRTGAELDDLAQLVARAIGVPVALITTFDETSQSFLGQHGLPVDLLATRGVPRAWSPCWHAVKSGGPLVAPDARAHPIVGESPLVEMGLVGGYAGAPFEVAGGLVGTVCVIDGAPRPFERRDIMMLEHASRIAAALLETRSVEKKTITASGRVGVGALLDDKYWLTATLGRGGQGEVFLARDRLVHQLVAIKVVSESSDEATLQHEAIALAAVRHPSVVRLYGWGRTPDDRLFIVLEYLEGETLAAHLRAQSGKALAFEPALAIVRELAEGLRALHAQGIVHADVKPANVILDAHLKRAVLVDFGVASIDANAGQTGGTPGFSAPEQFSGARPTPSADVYALAALTYALLRGAGPFAELDSMARILAQSNGAPPPIRAQRGDLPSAVDDVLRAALSPDPHARPASVEELADKLASAFKACR